MGWSPPPKNGINVPKWSWIDNHLNEGETIPLTSVGCCRRAKKAQRPLKVADSTRYHNQPMEWDLKLDLKPGENSVTIDQGNAGGH
jgi:hypothetical protein